MPKAPKKRLTVKEAKLVKAKAQGKKHVEAWDEAGYSQNSSEATKISNTQKILSKPTVQEALQAALAKHGVTVEKATKPIADALNDDDLDMRLKGSDRALKLMGASKGEGGDVHFHLHQAEMKEKYDL